MSRDSMGYSPGEQVPGTQYRVLRLLGSGGHGSVYAVQHVFLDAAFVMKVLHGEHADQSDLTQRMMREARTLAKLRHPNIVEVHDGGLTTERPPRPFFVMESLNGLPLRELLREVPGGVGVLPALRIVIGILNGLHYAHSAGVIHRDIKPDNVFLHKSSTDVTVPKILDFGIAHLLLGRHLTGRLFLGTPRYSAPEQLRGEAPSARTDIYAAGLVLYELLTGEAPYREHREMHAIVEAHLSEPLPSVAARVRGVPAELDRLLAAMVAKEPEARPASAFAAAVALREVRALIERMQSASIHAPDFKTEPTPMENVLTLASPDAMPVVTEAGAPSRANPNDTVPDGPLLDWSHDPAMCATEPDVRGTADTPLDRDARTNTAPREPFVPKPQNDTDAMSAESLARGLLEGFDSVPPAPPRDASLEISPMARSMAGPIPVPAPRQRHVTLAVAGLVAACAVSFGAMLVVSPRSTSSPAAVPGPPAASSEVVQLERRSDVPPSVSAAPPPSAAPAPPASASVAIAASALPTAIALPRPGPTVRRAAVKRPAPPPASSYEAPETRLE